MRYKGHKRLSESLFLFKIGRLACCQLAMFFTLLGFPFVALADDSAKVKKIISATDDQLVFQVSLLKTRFTRAENKVITYTVTNNGRKPIYLVATTSEPAVRTKETSIVEVRSPIVYPDAHTPFAYSFIKVNPKRQWSGKLVIPASAFTSSTYNFEEAAIQVNLSYLLDISELSDCGKSDYSLPCLNTVYGRAKTLTLGNLVVSIIDTN